MAEREWIKRAFKRSLDASGASSADLAAIREGRADERLAVMIVDDNMQIIEALRDVLPGKYAVIACCSAEEVEARFTEEVRLVILDIKMAPVDGVTMFSSLRKRSERVPIVIHTAYPGDSEAVARLLDLAPAGFLLKGDYSLQHLEATLERALGGAPGGGTNSDGEGSRNHEAGPSPAGSVGALSRTRGARRASARSSKMTRMTARLRARASTTRTSCFAAL